MAVVVGRGEILTKECNLCFGGSRRGRDRIVDGFITTCAISAYDH